LQLQLWLGLLLGTLSLKRKAQAKLFCKNAKSRFFGEFL
jgi:hypothetical protein